MQDPPSPGVWIRNKKIWDFFGHVMVTAQGYEAHVAMAALKEFSILRRIRMALCNGSTNKRMTPHVRF
jgi:hypothetical protein